MNLNDVNLGSERSFIRKLVKQYDKSFALAYSGFGDADMINLYDDQGKFIPHVLRTIDEPLGAKLENIADGLGTTYFIPFSAMHRFQRSDSIWANRFAPTNEAIENGFKNKKRLLPMFLRYDCETDQWKAINPKESATIVYEPKDFGDDWSDQLAHEDIQHLDSYFKSFGRLPRNLDFLRFVVGGKEHVVTLGDKNFNRGITFEAPRGSLMLCVNWEIFDDILIGNYMKTTLHGDWTGRTLTSDFTRFVAKYGDNGRAKSEDELRHYFENYEKRAPLEHLWHSVEQKGKNSLRSLLSNNPKVFGSVKSTYRWLVTKR